ncbi:hypothetical protein EGW08_008886 [Elysia chlorotica]|uniref:Transcription elongation factor n=1 Tax=Elysia chlorotica TaxID=188477 RepID=A0A3S1BGD6_ELYCH|nr:hypothetical protein EGW08_008886 [Elysia chlorotica]
MGIEDDVLKIGKKLEKLVSSGTQDHSQAMDLLSALRDTKMTLDVLQKTRIGMTVNNLRKASNNDEVMGLSKTLIKNWKKLLSNDSPGVPRTTSRSSGDANSQKMDETSNDGTDEAKDSGGSKDDNGAASSKCSNTTDAVRLKCRELLTNALKSHGDLEGMHDPEEVAAAIEDAIYEEFNNTEMKYKNRVRSRVANLKDVRNPQLRQNVLIGLISAKRIAGMTSEEMASNEMKQLREKLTKEAIDDHQMAKTGGTETDLFRCGKCRQNKCTYTQIQTRSADEPMTTFVYCMHCGNRWKFC